MMMIMIMMMITVMVTMCNTDNDGDRHDDDVTTMIVTGIKMIVSVRRMMVRMSTMSMKIMPHFDGAVDDIILR